jgi:hypothetical protein|tara:strand:- start:1593 stop:2822 length:1230 start_codon:yes stop_codon:yes gene_type:complete
MKIAYGKLGRSIPLTLEGASNVGGDIEVVRLLHMLREEHEVHLISRNKCDDEHPNMINHWKEDGVSTFSAAVDFSRGMKRFPDDKKWLQYSNCIKQQAHKLPTFDAWFIWIGQHGTSLSFLPRIAPARIKDPRLEGVTRPLQSDMNYGYPVVELLNELDVQPYWLCPDPRNVITFRNIANHNQHPILAQFQQERNCSFTHPEHGLKRGTVQYEYSGIELLAIPKPNEYEVNEYKVPQQLFGLLVNEGYSNLGKHNRVELIRQWIKDDCEIYGHWCKESQQKLGLTIEPIPLKDVNATLQRWKATMTFPASGTGWATAKPWECFKAGTICFKHPRYDSQEHIYGKHMSTELHQFLCPRTQSGLNVRLKELEDNTIWHKYAKMQREYLMASYDRLEEGSKAIRDVLKCTSL